MPNESSDHDLLIRLDTRFDDFSKTHNSMWTNFTELVQKFISTMDKKADKLDMSLISKQFDDLEKRVTEHDTALKVNNGKKEFAVQIGEWGIKGWGAILGTVAATTAIINLLSK